MPNTVRIPFGNPEYPTGSNVLTEALGIRMEDPYGHVHSYVLDGRTHATIGQLVNVNGLVHAIPRHNLTPRQHSYFAAAAEEGFFKPPCVESGWEPDLIDGELRWTTSITVSAALTSGPIVLDLPNPSMPASRIQGAA
jgi:hypothetical protein